MAHNQLQSINQTIRMHLYSAMCRKQIRGPKWQARGGVSSDKQFQL